MRRKKLEKRQWFREYKADLACTKCGTSHPAIIDFHIDGSKDFTISRWLVDKNCSIEDLQKEIAKCEVLCANCHRIEHWKD